jgi:hypothetical protein
MHAACSFSRKQHDCSYRSISPERKQAKPAAFDRKVRSRSSRIRSELARHERHLLQAEVGC